MRVANPIGVLAIWLGGRNWLPRFAPYIVKLDMFLRKLTRGRFTLLTLSGLPELFLTVPGRKSGIPRTTPLLCVPHKGGWLIAGSNWGQPKPPMWVGNLEAADRATVGFHGRDTVVTPRLMEGAERAELFQVMLGTWPNYTMYERKSERELKVFWLTPAE